MCISPILLMKINNGDLCQKLEQIEITICYRLKSIKKSQSKNQKVYPVSRNSFDFKNFKNLWSYRIVALFEA